VKGLFGELFENGKLSFADNGHEILE